MAGKVSACFGTSGGAFHSHPGAPSSFPTQRGLVIPNECSLRAPRLRAHANKFVPRATRAALTASKGTGLLKDHPAQRWARQALFFLVWSCPRPAVEATLAYLMAEDDKVCL